MNHDIPESLLASLLSLSLLRRELKESLFRFLFFSYSDSILLLRPRMMLVVVSQFYRIHPDDEIKEEQDCSFSILAVVRLLFSHILQVVRQERINKILVVYEILASQRRFVDRMRRFGEVWM